MPLVKEKLFDKIESQTELFVKRSARDLSVAILRAYKNREDVVSALYGFLDIFEVQIVQALVAAHASGILESIVRAANHLGKGLGPYDAAVSVAKRRMNMTKNQIKNLQDLYGSYASNVTHGMGMTVEKKARKAVKEIIERNYHVKKGMAHLRSSLTKAGVTATNPWMLETTVRTQIQIAYSAGRWEGNQIPEIQDVLWGFEYITAGDFRVRPEHEMLEGVRQPKEHPIWTSIWPPNGFNCRCDVIEIYKDQPRKHVVKDIPAAKEIGGKLVVPGPDASWAINHGEILNSNVSVSPELMQKFSGKAIRVVDKQGNVIEVVPGNVKKGVPSEETIAEWHLRFEKVTTENKKSWMKVAEKSADKGKLPDFTQPFWTYERVEYFNWYSKKISGGVVKKVAKEVVKVSGEVTEHGFKVTPELRTKYSSKLKLEKVHEQYRDEVERAFIELQETYHIKGLNMKVAHVPNDAIAEYDKIYKVIKLDPKYFGKRRKYDVVQVIKDNHNQKYFVPKNVTELIQHEYGHAIARRQGVYATSKVFDYFNGKDFITEGLKHQKKMKTLARRQISWYASKNSSELTAESFVQFINGKASPMAKEVMKMLKITEQLKMQKAVTKIVKPVRKIVEKAPKLPRAAITERDLRIFTNDHAFENAFKYPNWETKVKELVDKGYRLSDRGYSKAYRHNKLVYRDLLDKHKVKMTKDIKKFTNYSKWREWATYDEQVAVSFYRNTFEAVQALRQLTTGIKPLLPINTETLNLARQHLPNLAKVLSRAPKMNPGTLYRGVKLTGEEISKIAVGKDFTFQGFTSTSLKEDRTIKFLHDFIQDFFNSGKKNVIFKLKTSQGVEIQNLYPQHKDWLREVMLKPGAKYRVENVATKQSSKIGKYMEITLVD